MYRAYARTGVDPAASSAEEQARLDGGVGRVLAGALAEMRVEHRDALLLHALGDSPTRRSRRLEVPLGP